MKMCLPCCLTTIPNLLQQVDELKSDLHDAQAIGDFPAELRDRRLLKDQIKQVNRELYESIETVYLRDKTITRQKEQVRVALALNTASEAKCVSMEKALGSARNLRDKLSEISEDFEELDTDLTDFDCLIEHDTTDTEE